MTKIRVVSATPTPKWTLRIAVAEELKRRGIEPAFSFEDRGDAANWQMCVCGNQDQRIPRMGKGDFPSAPVDRILRNLGTAFYDEAVSQDNVQLAKTIMDKIERRAALLISRLQAEQKAKVRRKK